MRAVNRLRRRLLAATAIAALPRGPVHAQSALTRALRSGALRIGVDARTPPLATREEARLLGYDIEVGERIAAALGLQPRFVEAPWRALFARLEEDAIDLALGGLSYTRERLARYACTLPYVETSIAMLIRAGDVDFIRGIADLNGRVVAIERGSPAEALQDLIQRFLRSGHGMGFRELRRYDDLDPPAYTMLLHTRVDVVLHRLPALTHVWRQAPDLFLVVRATGGDAWAGALARRGEQALADAVSDTIRALRADGTLPALQMRWFGMTLRLPDAIPVPA